MSETQPFVVAVTGHRDLVASECPGIRDRVRALFDFLTSQYANTPLKLLSPLAEGADQLAAEVALECGVGLIVALPMAVPEYLADFESEEGIENFHALCESAEDIFMISGMDNVSTAADKYSQLGVFQAAHCHVLLAIWDGKASDKPGGTSQVVQFHHDDFMPSYPGKAGVSQQMLIDDESDLIYHIVCSRDHENGGPEDDLEVGDWWWFTKDEHAPRSKLLPPSHDRVFQRADDFSHDCLRFGEKIQSEAESLLSADGRELEVDGLEPIDGAFRCADYLAMHYQRKSLRTLRAIHILAFLMGLLFILYSDVATSQLLLYLFLACFMTATLLQLTATRRGWFRKYLDYRTLAEGLRVQFYWALAGISQNDLEHYSHDNFLQLQDPEVGWIRNAMRVAGLTSDALPNKESAALATSTREWVGNDNSGQLGYYARKSAERIRRRRFTDSLGTVSLIASATVMIALLFAAGAIPEHFISPMIAAMGAILLLFAVRHGYAHAIAETELIKQYAFMYRIFANARKRLDSLDDDERRREVLMALGSSALDEHAQWIMMHRERSVDQMEIWRMGSGS